MLRNHLPWFSRVSHWISGLNDLLAATSSMATVGSQLYLILDPMGMLLTNRSVLPFLGELNYIIFDFVSERLVQAVRTFV